MRESYEDKFKREYMLEININQEPYYICGDCIYFINGGCSTSYIENKYGNAKTKACNEDFKLKGVKMNDLNIENIGNNCWIINEDKIYAPSEHIAIERYCEQSGNTHLQDQHNRRMAIKKQNIMELK